MRMTTLENDNIKHVMIEIRYENDNIRYEIMKNRHI